MKGSLVTGFIAITLVAASHAQVMMPVPQPTDDSDARLATWTSKATSEEIASDREAYFEIEGELQKIRESQLATLFGGSLDTVPPGYALPVHRNPCVGFSGAGYRGGLQSYFIPIEDLGGILVWPYGHNDYVSEVVLYLKTDASFVPLRCVADYRPRRKWEIQRTGALQRRIREVLNGRRPEEYRLPLTKETVAPSVRKPFEPRVPLLSDYVWVYLRLDDALLLSRKPWTYNGDVHYETEIGGMPVGVDWSPTWSREQPQFSLQPKAIATERMPFDFSSGTPIEPDKFYFINGGRIRVQSSQ
jgi:hypothetical protein